MSISLSNKNPAVLFAVRFKDKGRIFELAVLRAVIHHEDPHPRDLREVVGQVSDAKVSRAVSFFIDSADSFDRDGIKARALSAFPAGRSLV